MRLAHTFFVEVGVGGASLATYDGAMADEYWRTFCDYVPLLELVDRFRSAGLDVEPLPQPADGGLIARLGNSDAWLRVHYWVPYVMMLCHGDSPELRQIAGEGAPLLGEWVQGSGASQPDDPDWVQSEYAAVALGLFGPLRYTATVTADWAALLASRPQIFHELGTPDDPPDARHVSWPADADAVDFAGEVVLSLRQLPDGEIEVSVAGDPYADSEYALAEVANWLTDNGASEPEWVQGS